MANDRKMIQIGNRKFAFDDVYNRVVSIPDSFVVMENKIGTGHGEAKLYMGSKEAMRGFFANGEAGFDATFLLAKQDLLDFLDSLRGEYEHPTLPYEKKAKFPSLWKERYAEVESLPDLISFRASDQLQIAGERGYVNSKDAAYTLLRKLALPSVVYLDVMRVMDDGGNLFFYLKLFVDYDELTRRQGIPYALQYGKALPQGEPPHEAPSPIAKARNGQSKYRERLLEECPFCPITMISDPRLLVASHIKPWAVSSEKEKVDPKNGFMLSPLFDSLFDQGFITFTAEKHLIFSNWLSPDNIKRVGVKPNAHISRLPLDAERIAYLNYHREYVFKK